MKVNELLVELDLKGAAKKSGLADMHAKQQEKRKNEFEAKYNTGMPAKIKVKVYVKKPAYKQEDPYEMREFTIDNLINIRHKLDGITLIDMSSVEDDKTKHDGKITWAIKKDGRQLPGGLPEYLHDLPARTKKKAGFDPYDLRREAWTDTPMKAYESAIKEEGEGEAGVEANLATPNKKMKKAMFIKVPPQMNPYIRKKKVDEAELLEMAKRSTPDAFYKMAVAMYGVEKCKSVTMAEVKAVATKNDVLIPPYVVKQKVARGKFNLKPEGMKDEPTKVAQAPKKDEPKKSSVSEADLRQIAREVISQLKALNSSNRWMREGDIDPYFSHDGKRSVVVGLRDWGQWENPEDAEDEEDYDWQVLTREWRTKLREFADKVEKKYPGVRVLVQTGEKNYVDIQVTEQ